MQTISSEAYGEIADGRAVSLFTLRNRNGLTAQISNYGGAVTSLKVPDREGHFSNIVLGYDSLARYEGGAAYIGALIGRFGNRIADGRFDLDGEVYRLATNNHPNHLHGGERGFDKRVWEARAEETANGPSLLLSYFSEDGEEAFPGNLTVIVRYTLGNDDSLRIEYEATCDRATPVNLTHHGYFNLAGDPDNDVLGHEVEIYADHYTPVDSHLIPTGEITLVAGTPFDFRAPGTIGARINEDHEQLQVGGGYDHNFVLNKTGRMEPELAARVHEPLSGRVMEVHTSEPGVQFYSGNFLQGFRPRTGLCLETQHFPDSPNQPGFPSTILRPGESFRSQTIYSFFAR